eukprot:UN08993
MIASKLDSQDPRVIQAENVFQDQAILNNYNINVNIFDQIRNRKELAPIIEAFKRTVSSYLSGIMGMPHRVEVMHDDPAVSSNADSPSNDTILVRSGMTIEESDSIPMLPSSPVNASSGNLPSNDGVMET